MNDDDLLGPKLTPAPTTSPFLIGGAVVVVAMGLAVGGCTGDQNPGAPLDGGRIIDAGISVGDTYTTGVDTGPPMDSGFAPGVPAQDAALVDANDLDAHHAPGLPPLDAAIDANNPGDHP